MKRSVSISTKTAILAFALLIPSLALAHSGGDHVLGFQSGLEHPLFGLDHLLATVAVGIIAARTAGRGGFLVPVSFVSAMVTGAMLGMAGIGLPYLETGIALSLVTFGAVIGLAKPLPLAAATALATLFGLFHGNAHGFEIPESASGIAYAAGFVFGTSALHAVGALSALKLACWPATIRAAGVATSLVGMTLATQTI
jgi:urease accessory protein